MKLETVHTKIIYIYFFDKDPISIEENWDHWKQSSSFDWGKKEEEKNQNHEQKVWKKNWEVYLNFSPQPIL